MIKNILYVLITWICCQALAWASGISGFVLKENLEPLSYAIVTHTKTGSWVIADEEGRFLLQTAIEPSDSLVFYRYGYQEKTVVNVGLKQLKISMQRDAIPMNAVEVKGQAMPGNTPLETVIVTETDQMSGLGVFQRVPGILLKTYGGMAGISNVGMDGGQAEHAKIVLDGIDLTSPQNGQTDLSEIPLVFFQQMFQSRYPGIDYGSGSMDGVIQLSPWFNRSFLNVVLGSFGYKSTSVGYKLDFVNTAVQLIGGGFSSVEDYSFSLNDSIYNRENNGIDQTFFGGRVQFLQSRKTIIKSSLFLSSSDRGVAGSVSFPSLNAHRKNTLSLANAILIRILNSGHVSIQLSRRANDEQYSDPDFAVNSRHEVSSQRLIMKWNRRLLKYLEANTSLELRKEMINSSDIGNRDRSLTAASLSLAYNISPGFDVRPSIRRDVGKSFRATTTDFNVQVNIPVLGQIKVRFGNGFRLPTFNDMYWPSGSYSAGNPNLNPENSAYFSFGMERIFSNDGRLGLEWRERRTNNLITWKAGNDFVWRPENVAEALRKSYIISFNVPFMTQNLSISGYLTGNETYDLATDKALPYVPKITGQLLLQYSWENGTLDIQTYYSGERNYSGYDDDYNPIDITLDPFTNVSLGLHLTMPNWDDLRLHFTFENLLDKDTSFFPEYPEPGLRVNGGLSILL